MRIESAPAGVEGVAEVAFSSETPNIGLRRGEGLLFVLHGGRGLSELLGDAGIYQLRGSCWRT